MPEGASPEPILTLGSMDHGPNSTRKAEGAASKRPIRYAPQPMIPQIVFPPWIALTEGASQNSPRSEHGELGSVSLPSTECNDEGNREAKLRGKHTEMADAEEDARLSSERRLAKLKAEDAEALAKYSARIAAAAEEAKVRERKAWISKASQDGMVGEKYSARVSEAEQEAENEGEHVEIKPEPGEQEDTSVVQKDKDKDKRRKDPPHDLSRWAADILETRYRAESGHNFTDAGLREHLQSAAAAMSKRYGQGSGPSSRLRSPPPPPMSPGSLSIVHSYDGAPSPGPPSTDFSITRWLSENTAFSVSGSLSNLTPTEPFPSPPGYASSLTSTEPFPSLPGYPSSHDMPSAQEPFQPSSQQHYYEQQRQIPPSPPSDVTSVPDSIPDVCANCADAGHVAADCVRPMDLSGFIRGCAFCNGAHCWDDCPRGPPGMWEMIKILVINRARRPPMAGRIQSWSFILLRFKKMLDSQSDMIFILPAEVRNKKIEEVVPVGRMPWSSWHVREIMTELAPRDRPWKNEEAVRRGEIVMSADPLSMNLNCVVMNRKKLNSDLYGRHRS